MSLGTIIIIAIIVVVVIAVLAIYNSLVRGRLQVREAYSAIDIQLKRRMDLIPNLVETVKGYASHERETLDSVTQARAALQNASTPAQAAQADNQLTQTLRSLFAVAEAYPDLKANQNFLDLQGQLQDTEDKIAYARNYYNARVLSYNTSIATVPNVFIAGPFGFKSEEFFQADEGSRQEVRVSFS